MSGRGARDKGNRIEREIVEAHKKLGVHAERYPLSGSSRFRGSGHDIDLYPFGPETAPLVAEVKGRKTGEGFAMLERWLGEYDELFLRRDRDKPLVVMPWSTYERFLLALKAALKGETVRWTDGVPQQVSDETPEAGLAP